MNWQVWRIWITGQVRSCLALRLAQLRWAHCPASRTTSLPLQQFSPRPAHTSPVSNITLTPV